MRKGAYRARVRRTSGCLTRGARMQRKMVRDWIRAALEAKGIMPTGANIAPLERLVYAETGANPSYVGPYAQGIAAVGFDVWTIFGKGDPLDPVASIMCAIDYLLATRGEIRYTAEKYTAGGSAITRGVIGEQGKEKMLPLDDWRSDEKPNPTV